MKKSIALLFALLLPCVALASGGGEEENAAPKVAYYSLVPALVGNFGAGPKPGPDGALYFVRGGRCVRFDPATHKASEPYPLREDWLDFLPPA